ncbi:MAG: CapA family protein [Spirochaetes bacterium]|nr:CapA family protein [Spirochaetota bacterium]
MKIHYYQNYLKLFLLLFLITILNLNLNSQETISLSFVGDIMMGTTYPSDILPPNDGKDLFNDAKPFFDTDFILGNCEGTFTEQKTSTKDVSKPNNYAFRMPLRYINYLKEANFHILSIANNHSFDFGNKGYIDTIENLKKAGFIVIGEKGNIEIIEKKGLKFGFIGFSWFSHHNNILDLNNTKNFIKECKNKVDLLVVYFHGGSEGESAQRVKNEMEYFLGSPRGNVYQFARIAIDNGADIVVGHGPHVLRGMEFYKGKLIAYSLGNFCTYGMFSMKYPRNISCILKVYYDKNKNFLKGQIIPFILLNKGIPYYDKNKEAIKIINNLSKIDFGENGVKINENGEF